MAKTHLTTNELVEQERQAAAYKVIRNVLEEAKATVTYWTAGTLKKIQSVVDYVELDEE